MSIESEMQTLNANLAELNGLIGSLVGAIAANTSVAASITSPAALAAAAPAAEKPAKPRKPKTEATAVAAPAASAMGVSAEQVADDLAKAPAEAPQANDDPFGDLNEAETPAPTYTVDDVREVALKLRDATSMDKAKAFIATFGVDSIKYLPEDKFADFIAKANAAIAAAKDL